MKPMKMLKSHLEKVRDLFIVDFTINASGCVPIAPAMTPAALDHHGGWKLYLPPGLVVSSET